MVVALVVVLLARKTRQMLELKVAWAESNVALVELNEVSFLDERSSKAWLEMCGETAKHGGDGGCCGGGVG